MSMSSPGIILKSEFTDPTQLSSTGGEFAGFIEYMARKEALRLQYFEAGYNEEKRKQSGEYANVTSFKGFMDYMARKKAVHHEKDVKPVEEFTGVFTATDSIHNRSELKEVKAKFQEAQEKESIMWDDVISFDNDFLAKMQIYDSESDYLDDTRILHATRKMMQKFEKEENLQGMYWMASIHRNTDNIHIHIAAVEMTPSREKKFYEGKVRPRGKRKPKTLERMKASFGTDLLQMSDFYQGISKHRDKTIAAMKECVQTPKFDCAAIIDHFEQKDVFPPDWEYRAIRNHTTYRTLPPKSKHEIDKVLQHLEKEGVLSAAFKDYEDMIHQKGNRMKAIFGDRKAPDEELDAKRLKELNERLGNVLIKTLAKYQRNQNNKSRAKQKYQESYERSQANGLLSKQSPLERLVNAKGFRLDKDYQMHYDPNRRWKKPYTKRYKPSAFGRLIKSRSLMIEHEGFFLLNRVLHNERYRAAREYNDMMRKIEIEQAQSTGRSPNQTPEIRDY